SGLPRADVAQPVSLADVAPTILELAGLHSLPPADGRSLVPLMHGDPNPAKPVFSTLYHPRVPRVRLIAAQDATTKVIYDPNPGSWMQFDLVPDPHEQHPLPATDEPLRIELTRWESESVKALAARGASPEWPSPARLPPASVAR